MSSDRSEARATARELREAEARRERRREQLIRISVLAAVAVAILVVGVVVFANRSQEDSSAPLPAGVTEPAGGIVIGEESAPVTIDLWIDFQCPFCRDFEADARSRRSSSSQRRGTLRLCITRCRSWVRSQNAPPTPSGALRTRVARPNI